jgi:hypothetical protein
MAVMRLGCTGHVSGTPGVALKAWRGKAPHSRAKGPGSVAPFPPASK